MAANQPGMAVNVAIEEIRKRNLLRLLKPESIAVVGVSVDPSKAGSRILQALSNFPGRVMAVHPREKFINGVPCFSSLSALPEPVDLAVLVIPAEFSIPVAEEAAAKGIGGLLTISSGFAESSVNGAGMQRRLAEICRESGLRVLGPNTAGFLAPHGNCFPTFMRSARHLRKGRTGIVSQSGGVNGSLCFLIDSLGEGISLAVGLGNAIDVGPADLLSFMADDANTDVIVLALEGVPQGRILFDALRAVTPRKPVIALAAGRADVREFARSHTGNLMGSRQRTVAALEQAGAVVVNSIEAAAQAACILSYGRLAPREHPKVALVTGQAGPGLLIMDELKSAGIEMPTLKDETIRRIQSLLPPLTFVNNPVDTGLPIPAFPEIVAAVTADPQIDLVLAFSLAETAILDSTPALAKLKQEAGKPVVLGILGVADDIQESLETLRRSGVPVVRSPERLALAGVVLAADAKARWRLGQSNASGESDPQVRLEGQFDEHRAKTILEQYGVCCPARVQCQSRDEAVTAFKLLQTPVVAKIADADITHKTEVGGVHLNLLDEVQLMQALDALARISGKEQSKFLLEEMAPAGIELIVGGLQDSSWGPIVMLGLGGILAEALEDTAIRLAPVSDLDVEDMINSLHGRKLLDGFRNLPVCNRAAIRKVVMAISQLLTEHPEVSEVEINPLRVYSTGALALDAVLRLKDDR